MIGDQKKAAYSVKSAVLYLLKKHSKNQLKKFLPKTIENNSFLKYDFPVAIKDQQPSVVRLRLGLLSERIFPASMVMFGKTVMLRSMVSTQCKPRLR